MESFSIHNVFLAALLRRQGLEGHMTSQGTSVHSQARRHADLDFAAGLWLPDSPFRHLDSDNAIWTFARLMLHMTATEEIKPACCAPGGGIPGRSLIRLLLAGAQDVPPGGHSTRRTKGCCGRTRMNGGLLDEPQEV